MTKLKFNITWFEDMKTIGYIYPLVLNDIKERMIEEIKKGNSIIIQRDFANANPDIIYTFKSVEEIEDFINNYK